MSGNYGEGGHGCHSKEEKFEGRILKKKIENNLSQKIPMNMF